MFDQWSLFMSHNDFQKFINLYFVENDQQYILVALQTKCFRFIFMLAIHHVIFLFTLAIQSRSFFSSDFR